MPVAHHGFLEWLPHSALGPMFHLMVLSAQFTVAVLILAGVVRSFIKLFHRS